ncbi:MULTISPECIES: YqzE family protein [Cohnella]|uniref:YqzE family protein n=1 Tax=Cohnella TaxID=329857 RepID=UPI0009BB5A0F|nr:MULTISPECIES: YqzE family protein [Cohnella]MBN2984626.1 YqzE family protein [Cohnella algarum]
MGDGLEWLKLLTNRFAAYLTTPAESKKEQKQRRKQAREPWGVRWFGLLAVGVQLWWQERKKNKPHVPGS